MNSAIKQILKSTFDSVLLLIAFFIPLYQNIITPLIILLIISFIFEKKYISFFSKSYLWHTNFQKFIFYSIIGFYLIHLIGLVYSTNLSFGFLDIQIKLAIFLFPILLLYNDQFKNDCLNKILLFFISGSYVACVLNLLISSFYYIFIDQDKIHFTPEKISHFQHIGYFSIYLNFAWFTSYYLLLKNKYSKFIQFMLASTLPFFAFFILLTGSKNGIILLVILGILFTIYAAIKTKKIRLGISIFVSLIIGLLFILTGKSVINTRIERAIQSTTSYDHLDKTSVESTAARLMAWDAALDLIKENLIFGVGTGDIKDELMLQYKQKGYTGILEEKLNPHNQYLQTFGALGIVGFLFIVTMYLSLFVYSIKQKSILLFAFSLIVIISSMTESILERQAGVLFFGLFSALFSATKKSNSIEIKKG